jgi:integrase
MARAIHKLKFRQVETLKKVGRHSDGGGLYLKITPDGSKRWVFMYARGGKQREMGLGSAQAGGVSLTDARIAAQGAREALALASDPLLVRDSRRQAAAEAQARPFGEVADEHIAAMASQWRNAKHRAQWKYSLEVLAKPLRPIRVDQISTEDVLSVLKPLWQTIPETAARVRGRIEAVIDRAKAKGERQAENPARWRGHLQLLLPKRQKLTRGHHPALPYVEVPEFMGKLRLVEGLAAQALELCILTATRTTELLGAKWDEIDLEGRAWSIPPGRMKAGKQHVVPLSDRAVAILKALRKARDGTFVFPSARTNKRHMSNMSMTMCLRRMSYGHISTHGFRSSFKDWAGEQTNFANEVSEAALAHVIKDKAEAAYRRATMFDKRRKLMSAWAQHCEPRKEAKVVQLRRKADKA